MRKTVLVVGGLLLLGYCGGFDSGSEEPRVARTDEVTSNKAARADHSAHEDSVRAGAADDAGSHRATRPRRSKALSEPAHKRRPAARIAAKATPTRQGTRTYAVVDVVDGDTVKVAYRGQEVSVRVIGIDTPETVHPTEPVECGGPEASAAAANLLSGERVRLVFDPSQGRYDAYDRMLAYLHVPGQGDFGTQMIRRGRAAEYTYDTSYARQAGYQAAEAAAQAAGRGIWDRCGGVDTPQRTERPADTQRSQSRQRPRNLVGAPAGGGCAPGYDPCVPPSSTDLDCADIDGPVRVTGEDPHGFDADGDGIGCDS
jgi:micrococcal nuclease